MTKQRFNFILSLYECMKKIPALIIILNLFAASCMAQFYAEPLAGYQTDLNNKANRFSGINTGIQLSWHESRYYEFVLQLQKNWGTTRTSGAAAFTLNPALPVYFYAVKKIQPASWTFAAGHRFIVTGKRRPNILSILLYSGIVYQHIGVSYDYDKSNYIILNPDQAQKKWGLSLSGGVEYMRQLTNGRLFFQLNISTPPSGKKTPPYSSFNFGAPLSFNAGYSILLKKNKHVKI